MQHFFEDLLKHLDAEVANLSQHVCSRVLPHDDYTKLVGNIEAYAKIKLRVQDDYDNWRQGQ